MVGHTEVIAQNGALSYRRLPSSCGHALATIGERISHSHPALTVAGASRVQHHCGTCGDRDATDFFCSALPAHIARPIRHRSSRFSRPAFFCRAFFWALLQANSCVRQLRVFCLSLLPPESTVSGQTGRPLLRYGDYPSMWLINTMVLGVLRSPLRWR